MSESEFTRIMEEHSDEKLIAVLKNRKDYKKEAKEAALIEAIKRKIIVDDSDLQMKYPSYINELDDSINQNYIKIQNIEKAKSDMLYGAGWCLVGIIATYADIGYIFWGAIVFGGFQFVRGAINYLN
jgi:GTP:adenosylcobinamide-phosphate guanylyltransferase